MALKGYRNVGDGVNTDFFMNATSERGVAVVLSTAGSGVANDDASALASLPTKSFGSGEYPLGILLCDVVSGDLTKTHLNQYKNEVQVGGKVEVLYRGTVSTDKIEGTPAGGYAAYVSSVGTDGKLTGVAPGASSPSVIVGYTGVAATAPYCKQVGTFLSSKDSEGYAKIQVNLI
jgi:hypothetical protein